MLFNTNNGIICIGVREVEYGEFYRFLDSLEDQIKCGPLFYTLFRNYITEIKRGI